MIDLSNKPAGYRILELGGGDNPNPNVDCNVDVRSGPRTHFTQDFEQFPWAIRDNDFDCVYAHFLLEHISFRLIPQFLKEVWRIVKPGGRVVMATPNTTEQINWIRDHPDGWDDKDFFTAASEVLFGSNDYRENTHRAYLSPYIAISLFREAGFGNVLTRPYGERNTDMVIEADKPTPAPPLELLRNKNAGDDPYSLKGRLVYPANMSKHSFSAMSPDKAEPAMAPGGFQPNVETTQFRSKERVCGHTGPNGMICSRQIGHDGNHSCEI